MTSEEMEGTEKAREGKGREGKRVRGMEGQQAATSVLTVTEVSVFGKVMTLMMDIQNWQGGHAGDGVHKQVYAMSCLSDVIRYIGSLH